MSRMVSFALLVIIVLVCAALAVRVMAEFLLPMFLAVVFVVIFRPLHVWLAERLGGRERIAAGVTTALILLIVLVPILLLITFAATESVGLAAGLSEERISQKLGELREQYDLDMPGRQAAEQFAELLVKLEAANVSEEDRYRATGELAQALEELRPAVGRAIEQRHAEDESGTTLLFKSFGDLRRAVDALVDEQPSEDGAGHVTEMAQVRARFDEWKRLMYGPPWLYGLKAVANPNREELQAVQDSLQEWFGPLALSTTQVVSGFIGRFAIGLVVMIVSLYFFLADGPGMVSATMRLSPLEDRYEQELLGEFDKISRAVVVATLLSALVQGLLASIAYLVIGFESFFLLTLLTCLLAMVPFVGAAAVWGACCVWLLLIDGRWVAASALAVYGTLVVSMADNVIKPLILHGQSHLHPLLALLSVLGGVQALGPIGIFVGPMVVAFLQALLNILRSELLELDRREKASSDSAAVPPT